MGAGQYVGVGDAQMALVRKLGAGWIREDLHVGWGGDDQIADDRRGGYFAWANEAKAQDLSVIATYFDYGLVGGQPPTTDETRARYAKRFTQLVERFSDVTDVFEVWNEPNIGPASSRPTATHSTTAPRPSAWAMPTTPAPVATRSSATLPSRCRRTTGSCWMARSTSSATTRGRMKAASRWNWRCTTLAKKARKARPAR